MQCAFMAETAGWEKSEQRSNKETLSTVSILLLGIRAQEQQGCQGLGALGVPLELLFLWRENVGTYLSSEMPY